MQLQVHEDVKLTWEKLRVAEPKHEFGNASLYRTKVPGGWLIQMFYSSGHSDFGVATSFYPDPGHAWDGGSLP